jgi:hypothetical protein
MVQLARRCSLSHQTARFDDNQPTRCRAFASRTRSRLLDRDRSRAQPSRKTAGHLQCGDQLSPTRSVTSMSMRAMRQPALRIRRWWATSSDLFRRSTPDRCVTVITLRSEAHPRASDWRSATPAAARPQVFSTCFDHLHCSHASYNRASPIIDRFERAMGVSS